MLTQITITWTIHDVTWLAGDRYNAELSDEDAAAVLEEAQRRHDASIGISWDVLDVYLSDLLARKQSAEAAP